ncbi:class I SAM-dependent methyltransferase [Rugosimonospora africana]|uniref:S-adenosyl-L-methionine-dependent methyltransferase n=1 Tax=Rugosimonospora africana TaxID=556532 RepID=A0A8J3VVN8_9ACTN|nr:class I SAM-dependent methyltransferase [Rugosimonospora africana]GIH20862.1 SAM-dependent methyltransferase [Rugosimonospora africana]
METNRASRTAEHVALFRALESSRRRDRLFDDPYAARFLSPRYRLVASLARVPALGRRFERYIDTHWSGGPRGSAVVRTRLIDDLLTEALAGGATQIVLLGAGYDSRAYRIPAAAAATVFEVDHPATQAAKRRLIGASARQISFVPADLLHDDLDTELGRAGFRHGVRTVVIWEGVTNYLTAGAVDATLRFLAGATGAGSRIIFTYVDRAALDGSRRFDGLAKWQAAVRDAGEPWTFGFDPAELPGYLAERGLTLTTDLSTRDAAARYLTPLGRDEPTASFYRIVAAEVR